MQSVALGHLYVLYSADSWLYYFPKRAYLTEQTSIKEIMWLKFKRTIKSATYTAINQLINEDLFYNLHKKM